MNTHMRRFLLFLGVGSLALSLACGGGSNGGGFGSGGGGNGSFTNSSLSGQYVYQLSGFDLQSGDPFREAGVFTADGNGHITSGTDDFSEGTFSTGSTTGTYSVSSDGTAQLNLSFGNNETAIFALTLGSSSKIYMIEADNLGLACSGVAVKQDPTAISASAVPTGTYVFREHSVTFGSSVTSASEVGRFTVASDGTLTGNADSDRNFIIGSSTLTGIFQFPSTNGRGTGTISDTSTNTTSGFAYYIVDANHLVLFGIDANTILLGQAEKQTGAFTTASLNGPYAFGSNGDTSSVLVGVDVAGRFNADGNGTISAGSLDAVQDGTATGGSSPVAFTGTYTVASTGRADVTFTSSGGSTEQIFWMVSPTRAFFVTNSANAIEDGSIDAQTGTFSSASLSGAYAFNLTGIDDTAGGDTNDFVGTLTWNGTSSVSMRTIANITGSVAAPTTLSGNYTVTSNGRAVANINQISNNLVFYMISPTDAYIVQNDTNVQIQGSMTKQQ